MDASTEEEDINGKRRRLETDVPLPYRQAGRLHSPLLGYEEDEYRVSGHRTASQISPRDNLPVHTPNEERYRLPRIGRRSVGDESMETSLPLARRRGDAAQAKASRLHIDTGLGESYIDSQRSQPLSNSHPHGSIKSAPPHKMTFSERTSSASFDPRGEPPPLTRSSASYNTGSVRHDTSDHALEDVMLRREVPPVNGGQSTSASFRNGVQNITPQTSRASAFIPQTATLPSPAYHTTQFIRQSPGSAVPSQPPGTATASVAPPNLQPTSASLKSTPPNPPHTARLPDHLRSPPSSKTQFLSLFSNFYDSLTDSRTLKATLEDQVRRSNTLLQTLQKSAHVLEMTVDRRLKEERSIWEAKIEALEERCRQLEANAEVISTTAPANCSHATGATHSDHEETSSRHAKQEQEQEVNMS